VITVTPHLAMTTGDAARILSKRTGFTSANEPGPLAGRPGRSEELPPRSLRPRGRSLW
jgi:hypothetical protein